MALTEKLQILVESVGGQAVVADFQKMGAAGESSFTKLTIVAQKLDQAQLQAAQATAAVERAQAKLATTTPGTVAAAAAADKLQTAQLKAAQAAERVEAAQIKAAGAVRSADTAMTGALVSSDKLAASQEKVTTKAGALGGGLRSVTTAAGGLNLGLNPLAGSLSSLDRAMGLVDSNSSKVTKALTGIGAGAVAVGAVLTKMGDDSKRAEAQLRAAVENTGNSFDLFEGRIGKVSDRLIKLGFDDEATARSLATLTTATQDPTAALELMGVTADIAAARHISLESAADKVAKAQTGNTKVFKEFGIVLGSNATEAEKAAAMMELARRVNGQAAQQADNLSGKLKELAIRLENVAEEAGAKFGPALTVAGAGAAALGGVAQATGKSGKELATSIGLVATAAGKAGLQLGGMAAALYAGQKAGEAIRGEHESFGKTIDRQINKVPYLGDALQNLRITHRTSGEEAKKHADAEADLGKKIEDVVPPTKRVADAMDDMAAATKGGIVEFKGLSSQAADTRSQLDKMKDAAGGLSDKLDKLRGGAVSVDKATIDYEESLASLREELGENGRSLDLHTEAGRKNQKAIDDVVEGIHSHVDALIKSGATTDEVRGKFNAHIEDLKRVLRQMGFNETQIGALITKYGLVPETVETAVQLLGVETAIAAADRAANEIAAKFSIAQSAARIVVEVFGAERAAASLASLRQDASNILANVDIPAGSPAPEGPAGEAAGAVLPGFAAAGILPARVMAMALAGRLPRSRVGAGFKTNGPRAIVGEGNPNYPEYVIATDPQYRSRNKALWRAAGRDIRELAAGGMTSEQSWGWTGASGGGAYAIDYARLSQMIGDRVGDRIVSALASMPRPVIALNRRVVSEEVGSELAAMRRSRSRA